MRRSRSERYASCSRPRWRSVGSASSSTGRRSSADAAASSPNNRRQSSARCAPSCRSTSASCCRRVELVARQCERGDDEQARIARARCVVDLVGHGFAQRASGRCGDLAGALERRSRRGCRRGESRRRAVLRLGVLRGSAVPSAPEIARIEVGLERADALEQRRVRGEPGARTGASRARTACARPPRCRPTRSAPCSRRSSSARRQALQVLLGDGVGTDRRCGELDLREVERDFCTGHRNAIVKDKVRA